MHTAELEVQEHMFALVGRHDLAFETADWSTGLIVPMAAGAVVHAGVLHGRVTVTVEPLTAEPALTGTPAEWDEIAEAGVQLPGGDLQIHQISYGPFDAPPGLPTLSSAGPGHYRVRVHARGRDTHHDQIVPESGEHYLIQCWPAEPLPPLVIRATDRCGYSMRTASLTQRTPDASPHAL